MMLHTDMLKNTIFLTFFLFFSSICAADVDYVLDKQAPYPGSKLSFTFGLGDEISVSETQFLIHHDAILCHSTYFDVDHTLGRGFSALIDMHGGQRRFDEFLKYNFDINSSVFKKDLTVESRDSRAICQTLSRFFVFKSDSAIYMISNDEVARFSKKKDKVKDVVQITDLPINGRDVNYCGGGISNRKNMYMYEGMPEELNKNEDVPWFEKFFKLPMVNGLTVYLGGYCDDDDTVSVKGSSNKSRGQSFLVIEKNKNINFIDIGENFSISKDFTIEVVKKSKKKIYKIDMNGNFSEV